MKTSTFRALLTGCAMLLPVLAQEPTPAPSPVPPATNAPPADSQPAAAAMLTNAQPQALTVTTPDMATNASAVVTAAPATNLPPVSAAPPPVPQMAAMDVAIPALPPLKPGELRMNFRNAPISLVLNYLSDAAGFIIEIQTPVQGTVDVWSTTPVTKEEAVDLLNSILNKNGYAAIRNGRKLTILNKADALHANIPVKIGNDPSQIPQNDEIITQIIPLRFVEAGQLVKDLAPMVSPKATIMSNDDGNSLAVTDTQSNIRHLVEIVKAIDSSAEDSTELRVFHLKHADATEMANLLNGLFQTQSSSTQSQVPMQFGRGFGFGRFGGFMGGGPPPAAAGGNANNAQSQRIKKRTQVTAVADARTSSVVVTATKDLISQIAEMVDDLDTRSPKETTVQVFHLNNADAQEVLPVLQDMFQSNNSSRNSRTSSTQNSPLMQRLQQSQSSSGTTGSTFGSGTGNSRGLGNNSF